MEYRCSACRHVLKPEETVVVVRQQDVTYDSGGLPRLIDVGSAMFFHASEWRGGTFRVRFRVTGRGRLDTLVPPS